ncbi:PhoX family protein [Nocardioides sp. AX2bis]|uniref:PhoX family protein n=1 Tax=Nocardioides sp. AX2bis TaxID=2653157 RepID=UPI0012F338A4|nr:PhoX family phosphatase [Nocardioides sp. AX2bis]VXB23739.1 Phosphatase [Nocardioides sp. AX2bis]
MTPAQPLPRTLLPLTPVGGGARRHGSRSLATCHYRCGSACDMPVPNTTEHGHVQDEITKVVGRRRVLQGAAVLGVAGAAGSLGGLVASPVAAAEGDAASRAAAAARTTANLGTTPFRPVAPNTVDAVRTAPGFTHDVIIRWGDPILPGAPKFDARAQTPEAAVQQFGYNCDYVGLLPTTGDKALLVVNHEYTNEELMFPADTYTAEEIKMISMRNHGMSVVTVKRGLVPGSWRQVKNFKRAPQNRRIHIETPFEIDGPAAGDERLKTTADPTGREALGTLNNCAGGMTPWGTVLSGEENFNQYFDGVVPTENAAAYARYGIAGGTGRGWSSVDPRFGLGNEPNEPHRFGWVVEVDPTDPSSTPRKHTMLGRFKHEGANVVIARNGRAVAHMGDDERGDYLYKFVSAGTYAPGAGRKAKRNNMQLLTKGTLYVAQLTGDGTTDGVSDGTGKWIPLCSDTESFVDGMDVADVLVFTRLAADRVAASGDAPTRMDRPEDVEHNPVNGKVYAALTNNTQRGTTFPVDEPNPVAGNRNGYVLEMTPDRGNHAGTTFTWNLLLVCGDPSAAETYFGGFPKDQVSPISCPDNVTFDDRGNLWVSTDGNALGSNDGVFRVPVEGPERGKVQQFLSVPRGAEACGPLIADGSRSLFFAVQHPGEDDGSTFDAPYSTWPHTNDFPRPSVCVAFKAR